MTHQTRQTSISSLAAIILAGGQSRRMGQDKALLQVDGQPLLARTCQIAAEICNPVSVVTPWVDRYRPVLPKTIHLIQEPYPDDSRSAGPLMGFLRGLTLQSSPWVLLLACDLPALPSAPLRSWAETLKTLPDATLAYVPRSPQGWEPLCGFYRTQSMQPLKTFADQGGRSFQRWLDTIPAQAITTDGDTALFNCNTPKDWQLFKDSIQQNRHPLK
jgi:molybdopterin-guanine dinucleotide biosynthesis protein A